MLRSLPPLLLLLAASSPVLAADAAQGPEADVAQDELMVVARSVMPRVAYRGLEATANPVRVQATVFPGRVFHASIDSMVGQLVGDDELVASASPATTAPAAFLEPDAAIGPLGAGPQGASAGAGGAPRGFTGSIGGSVLRATSGIGDRISTAVLRATGQGGRP